MAAFLHHHASLFDWLCNLPATQAAVPQITPSPYWQQHYDLGKACARPHTRMGIGAWHTVLINMVAPLLMAYGKLRDDPFYEARAEELLKGLPPERHHITRLWEQEGVHLPHALATQAALALYQQWCQESRCHSCSVGTHTLKHKRKTALPMSA